jgi:hypothetical protein
LEPNCRCHCEERTTRHISSVGLGIRQAMCRPGLRSGVLYGAVQEPLEMSAQRDSAYAGMIMDETHISTRIESSVKPLQ